MVTVMRTACPVDPVVSTGTTSRTAGRGGLRLAPSREAPFLVVVAGERRVRPQEVVVRGCPLRRGLRVRGSPAPGSLLQSSGPSPVLAGAFVLVPRTLCSQSLDSRALGSGPPARLGGAWLFARGSGCGHGPGPPSGSIVRLRLPGSAPTRVRNSSRSECPGRRSSGQGLRSCAPHRGLGVLGGSSMDSSPRRKELRLCGVGGCHVTESGPIHPCGGKRVHCHTSLQNGRVRSSLAEPPPPRPDSPVERGGSKWLCGGPARTLRGLGGRPGT